jgi:hypothetical protein
MSKSKHTEAQMIAALKQVEAGSGGRPGLEGYPAAGSRKARQRNHANPAKGERQTSGTDPAVHLRQMRAAQDHEKASKDQASINNT